MNKNVKVHEITLHDRTAILPGGERVELSPMQAAFMHFVMERRGELVRYSELNAEFWPEREGRHDAMQGLVWRIRKKMGKEMILSANGAGYLYGALIVE